MEAWTRLQPRKRLKRKKEKDQILKMKIELVGFTDGLDVGCERKSIKAASKLLVSSNRMLLI